MNYSTRSFGIVACCLISTDVGLGNRKLHNTGEQNLVGLSLMANLSLLSN